MISSFGYITKSLKRMMLPAAATGVRALSLGEQI
jgi:hypothetical protein